MNEKMPVEIKEKWINALRSGFYIQGEGELYNESLSENKGKPVMCCLGVLEHVCGTPLDRMDEIAYPGDIGGNAPEMFLTSDEGTISDILSDMNDGSMRKGIRRHSFLEIADFIEKTL